MLDSVAAVGASPALGERARLWTSLGLGLRVRTGWQLAAAPIDNREGGLYRTQVGVLLGDLGWVAVDANGEVGGRPWDQVGAGVSVALTRGFSLEAGGKWVYLAKDDALGLGWNVGISTQGE